MAESNKERKSQITDSQRRKNELIAELARGRSGMSLHAAQVGYQSDVSRRVKTSVRHHIGAWLAGALVTGGAISMLPMRKQKVYVNPLSRSGKKRVKEGEEIVAGGFFLSLVRMLLPLVKPILTAFITKKLATLVQGAEGAQNAAEKTTARAEHTSQAAARTAAEVAH